MSNTYVVFYEVTTDDGVFSECEVIHGETILEAVIKTIPENLENEPKSIFEAYSSNMLEQKPSLIQEEIGQLLFYDLFLEENTGIDPIFVLDITDPNNVKYLNLEDVNEAWNNRPGAKSFNKTDLQETNSETETETEPEIDEDSNRGISTENLMRNILKKSE